MPRMTVVVAVATRRKTCFPTVGGAIATKAKPSEDATAFCIYLILMVAIPNPHLVCCHRKQIICFMFFGHQTIIPLRFVISFCIYGCKGTYNYRHSRSKWQEKSVAGGCSLHNQRDIDTKRFAAFQGYALCVCGCRQCRRERALGHSPPSPSAPACRQAEKPQIQKVRLWR